MSRTMQPWSRTSFAYKVVTWNDYKHTTAVRYYVIEYGGMPGETATTTGLTTLTIKSLSRQAKVHLMHLMINN